MQKYLEYLTISSKISYVVWEAKNSWQPGGDRVPVYRRGCQEERVRGGDACCCDCQQLGGADLRSDQQCSDSPGTCPTCNMDSTMVQPSHQPVSSWCTGGRSTSPSWATRSAWEARIVQLNMEVQWKELDFFNSMSGKVMNGDGEELKRLERTLAIASSISKCVGILDLSLRRVEDWE